MILGECLSSYRAKACESFVRWDLDERARRAAPTQAAHQVDVHCRESRASEHEPRWNDRSRSCSRRTKIASVKRNHATDRQRPYDRRIIGISTPTKGATPLATEAQTQRGFVEENTRHMRNHRDLLTMIETMKCQNQHKR